MEEMNRSKTDLGFLVGAFAIGLLVFTPIFGILSDKFQNRKIPMLAGLLGLLIATALFPFAVEYWQLALARVAQGVSSGATWSIGLSMISDAYPADKVGVVMGAVLSANVVGQLLGPPIGGFLFQYVSREAPFIFCAALALIDLIARLYVEPPTSRDSEDSESVYREIYDEESPSYGNGTVNNSETSAIMTGQESPDREQEQPFGFFEMATNYPIVLLCFGTVAVSTAYSGFEATFTVYAREYFKMDETFVGLLFTAIVIPNIFLSVWTGHVSSKYGNWLVSALGSFILVIICPFIALPAATTTGLIIEIIVLMIFGASAAIAMTPIMPEMQSIVESKGSTSFGQVYALFNMAYSLGMLGGPILASYIFEKASFFVSVSFFSIFCFPFAILLLLRHFQEAKLKRSSYSVLH